MTIIATKNAFFEYIIVIMRFFCAFCGLQTTGLMVFASNCTPISIPIHSELPLLTTDRLTTIAPSKYGIIQIF
jgi:hypothetical protein